MHFAIIDKNNAMKGSINYEILMGTVMHQKISEP